MIQVKLQIWPVCLKNIDSTGPSEFDLSSFDTSNVTDMGNMFYKCETTVGYARTQADADKFNSSDGKPSGLTFVVK